MKDEKEKELSVNPHSGKKYFPELQLIQKNSFLHSLLDHLLQNNQTIRKTNLFIY